MYKYTFQCKIISLFGRGYSGKQMSNVDLTRFRISISRVILANIRVNLTIGSDETFSNAISLFFTDFQQNSKNYPDFIYNCSII